MLQSFARRWSRCFAAMVLMATLIAPTALAESWIVETDSVPLALRSPAQSDAERRRQVADANRVLDDLRVQIEARVERRVRPRHIYRNVTVGLALSLSADEAARIGRLPGVARVSRDNRYELPDLELNLPLAQGLPRRAGLVPSEPVSELLGAVDVWLGSAPDGLPHLGEGVIVGVLGEGIRGDHPSFAAVGDDGYAHINPYGVGVFAGECFATAELSCNAKLIGRYSFTQAADTTSEDPSGFSTYISSLAVGNRLLGETVAQTGLSLVAGIAPHANLIAYRTCNPTCATSDIIRAFDQAIDDGVDVLLYPIGSPAQSPWESILALAARHLRAAGVALVTGTGSSGPAPSTLAQALAAPWVVSANPSTHGVDFEAKTLGGFSGGGATPPPELSGRSVGGTYTARIVYAGSVPNPASPGEDPAQCLAPYPAGTFNGEILVCDRGQIARLQKSINALDSGAGGFVLANVPGGPDNVASDVYALPGIHIDSAAAQPLRAWLSEGTGHRASIAFAAPDVDPAAQDLLSTSASRGPNLGLSYLAPSVTAPALDVVGAALAPSIFRLSSARGNTPVAGALALLQSVHPDWTTAERVSALMSTAVAPLRESDGATPTGPFDHGAGRIDVAAAVRAGLVMDVTDAEFAAADPATGGRPQDLNLAGLVELDCVGTCQFVRTLRAARDGAWQVSAEGDGVQIDVSPAQFTLLAGEVQVVTIDVSVPGEFEDADYFGSLILVSQVDGVSDTSMPVAVAWRRDNDSDGIADAIDNCAAQSNPDQRDSDGDGFGNRCDADLNNDQKTNAVDLGLFRLRFGSSDPDADFDGSGLVDERDRDILGELFLRPPGPSGSN